MGTGNDADIYEGKIPTPVCKGHLDHTRVGQPLPPMVTKVRHAGALEGSERVARHHRVVCQGVGTEETADGIRGDVGESGEGLSCLRQDTRNGHLTQITVAGPDGGR